jgi:hypothetical protein
MADNVAETPQERRLPKGITQRIKGLISELEAVERQDLQRAEMGEIELKVSENEALWFVAYRTAQ